MKQPVWKKAIIFIFIIVATSIGGVVLGNLLTPDARRAARGIKWISLGIPPEGAVKIAGESVCGRSYEVVVQSASGKYYLYCSSEWRQYQSENGDPFILGTCQGNPPTQYSPGFDKLPYPVKDCGFIFTHEWGINETVYSVLEDGSVWKWDFTYGFNTIFKYWIGGLILGLIVGILISIGVWRKDGL